MKNTIKQYHYILYILVVVLSWSSVLFSTDGTPESTPFFTFSDDADAFRALIRRNDIEGVRQALANDSDLAIAMSQSFHKPPLVLAFRLFLD